MLNEHITFAVDPTLTSNSIETKFPVKSMSS